MTTKISREKYIMSMLLNRYKHRLETMKYNGDVKGLIKALNHKNHEIRKIAGEALAKIGEEAVDPLIAAARDRSHQHCREAAIEAIGNIKDSHAVQTLMRALSNRDGSIQEAAAFALGEIGDPRAVTSLIETLTEEKHRVRQVAASSLGKIGDPKAVASLANALTDRKRRVRQAAASALGEIGDSRAIKPLINALRDRDHQVEETVTSALVSIKAGKAKTVELLVPVILENKDPVFANKAFKVLDKLGWKPRNQTEQAHYLVRKRTWSELTNLGKDATKPLISVLKSDRFCRDQAIKILGEIGDPRAVKTLIEILGKGEQSFFEIELIVTALGKLGDPIAIKCLVEYLNRADKQVSKAAAVALGKIVDQNTIQPFIDLLREEFARFRKYPSLDYDGQYSMTAGGAAKALTMIGQSVVPSLVSALNDDERGIREAAFEALRELEWKPQSVKERTQFAIVGGHWDDIKSLGDEAVMDLLKALEHDDSKIRTNAARALVLLGNPKAREAILDFLFGPVAVGCLDNCEKAIRGLFGDYTPLILAALRFNRTYGKTYEDVKYPSHDYEYDLSMCNKAVSHLSKIETPIATNILYKISQREDIEVVVHWTSARFPSTYGTLSFREQRELAKKELARRGNPPYDHSVYLGEESWKL